MIIQIEQSNDVMARLQKYRAALYGSFARLPDATLDLIDALCSENGAKSPVELSESPLFRRSHGSLYQAISQCYGTTEANRATVLQSQRIALGSLLPQPSERSHVLLKIDVTANLRPDGETVRDRSHVYCGGGQIGVGHHYSVLSFAPELPEPHSWAVPLETERVPSEENKEQFGIAQAIRWASDPKLPFHTQLVVVAGDKAYNSKSCLHQTWAQANLVTLTSFRNNQVFYHHPEPAVETKRGRPRWYGEPFRLNDPDSWSEPSSSYRFEKPTQRGQAERVEVKAWSNMLMRGKRKPEIIPMHERPFTLVQVTTYRANGKPKYKRPLWLTAFGQRQAELSAQEIVDGYFQRSKIEHFNRFAKQHLLFDSFNTPDTFAEENWAHLVGLAYQQLYLAQPLCAILPKPWQKHLPQFQNDELPFTPAMVKRDFARIIGEIGSPAKAAKRRGNSSGRPQGSTKPPRARPEIVRKGKKKKKRKK